MAYFPSKHTVENPHSMRLFDMNPLDSAVTQAYYF
jgi:hypothetical protein